MQQIEPVAVAEEGGRFRKTIAAEADAIAAQRVDLEPVFAAIAACEIAAIPLARDFQIIDAVIELDADGNRKRRCQRPAAPPRRRVSVGDVKQQRGQRRVRGRVLTIWATPSRTRYGRLPSSSSGLAFAGCCRSSMARLAWCSWSR
jgi:hypothetical protein